MYLFGKKGQAKHRKHLSNNVCVYTVQCTHCRFIRFNIDLCNLYRQTYRLYRVHDRTDKKRAHRICCLPLLLSGHSQYVQ